ncbi:hypothetical protein SY2F82_52460 [Streptomyces sp. Y2F8-2]|nr:hypothetical protein SY2F82_52120 [Streptomyces sp. Y2F8-2]GHK03449.1 hypothetical protein SY2F82_52460 [Streptomyces sp. Y2F8-2]
MASRRDLEASNRSTSLMVRAMALILAVAMRDDLRMTGAAVRCSAPGCSNCPAPTTTTRPIPGPAGVCASFCATRPDTGGDPGVEVGALDRTARKVRRDGAAVSLPVHELASR